MRIRPSSYFLMGILAFTLLFGTYSFTYPSIQTKLLPLLVAGIVFVLASIELAKELMGDKGPKEPAQHGKSEKPKDQGELFKYCVTFFWIIGLMLAVYMVGFLIGTFLFIVSYLRFHVRHGWVRSAIVAAIAVATIYIVFIAIFKAKLFPGLLLMG